MSCYAVSVLLKILSSLFCLCFVMLPFGMAVFNCVRLNIFIGIPFIDLHNREFTIFDAV